jgi:23S rRNA pseudouridine2604 synthase
MTPPTLKLPPRSGPTGPAKPPTSRQRRAQHGRAPTVALAPGHTLATPPAPPDAPPRRKKPATAPRGKTGLEPALRRPPASTRSEAPPAAYAAPHVSLTPLVPENPRLSKRMSELGLCSRREADEWIENGWVKVDGVVTNTLGTRVAPAAEIEIDAAARRHQSEQVTFLLHKPIGYVSGQAEDGYQPASVLIRPENRWPEDRAPLTFKPSQLRGLAPAGRLDIDSTGLIVFTQDGRVARRLIGRDSEVEKEYLVRVEGALSPAGMKQLQHGLELDGVQLKPARVSWQNEHQLRFVLREGRKRQIRRMCELVGLAVTGLKRVRTGSVVLGKLPVGQWRYLRADEKF